MHIYVHENVLSIKCHKILTKRVFRTPVLMLAWLMPIFRISARTIYRRLDEEGKHLLFGKALLEYSLRKQFQNWWEVHESCICLLLRFLSFLETLSPVFLTDWKTHPNHICHTQRKKFWVVYVCQLFRIIIYSSKMWNLSLKC